VIRILVTAGLLIGLAAVAPAQSLDPASREALDQALRILLDPAARSAEVSRTPQGAAADQQVRALAGSEALSQEVYALAGQMLSELVQSTGGDTQKMLQALDRARTDPAAFAALLSPATQQRLRELAVKLSDKPR